MDYLDTKSIFELRIMVGTWWNIWSALHQDIAYENKS